MWRRLIAMEKHKIWRNYCTGGWLPISRDLAIDLLVYDGETSRKHVTSSWLNCWYIFLEYSLSTSMEVYMPALAASASPSAKNRKCLLLLEKCRRLSSGRELHFRHRFTSHPPCPTHVRASSPIDLRGSIFQSIVLLPVDKSTHLITKHAGRRCFGCCYFILVPLLFLRLVNQSQSHFMESLVSMAKWNLVVFQDGMTRWSRKIRRLVREMSFFIEYGILFCLFNFNRFC